MTACLPKLSRRDVFVDSLSLASLGLHRTPNYVKIMKRGDRLSLRVRVVVFGELHPDGPRKNSRRPPTTTVEMYC